MTTHCRQVNTSREAEITTSELARRHSLLARRQKILSVAFAASLAVTYFAGAGDRPAAEPDRGLIERVAALEAMNPAPVGTIIAYAGEWPPTKSKSESWAEEELGWMLCDGRPYPDSLRELSTAIETFYRDEKGHRCLPDLRGEFLRGLDYSAMLPEARRRRDVDRDRTLGTPQGYATAKPHKGFETGFQSDNPTDHRLRYRHSHVFGTGSGEAASYFGGGNDAFEDQKAKGNHTHKIECGGDNETRPRNIAVNYIIKVKP